MACAIIFIRLKLTPSTTKHVIVNCVFMAIYLEIPVSASSSTSNWRLAEEKNTQSFQTSFRHPHKYYVNSRCSVGLSNGSDKDPAFFCYCFFVLTNCYRIPSVSSQGGCFAGRRSAKLKRKRSNSD